MANPAEVTYRTQVGVFDQGHDKPCAVNMKVHTYPKEHGAQAFIALSDKDGHPMGTVCIGEADMKRLVMQFLMEL